MGKMEIRLGFGATDPENPLGRGRMNIPEGLGILNPKWRKLWNHRIPDGIGLEGIFGIIQIQLPRILLLS